jgi:hypothetical protein
MSEEESDNKQVDNKQPDFFNISKDLKKTLDFMKEGVREGVTLNLSTQPIDKGLASSTVDKVNEVLFRILNPLAGGGTTLDRPIREGLSEVDPEERNIRARKSFSDNILTKTNDLVVRKFFPFIDFMEKNKDVMGITIPDKSDKRDAYSEKYQQMDNFSTYNDPNSPANFIINELIPQLKYDFEDIKKLNPEVGSGAEINSEEISKAFLPGTQESKHVDDAKRILRKLYYATKDFALFTSELSSVRIPSNAKYTKPSDTQEKMRKFYDIERGQAAAESVGSINIANILVSGGLEFVGRNIVIKKDKLLFGSELVIKLSLLEDVSGMDATAIYELLKNDNKILFDSEDGLDEGVKIFNLNSLRVSKSSKTNLFMLNITLDNEVIKSSGNKKLVSFVLQNGTKVGLYTEPSLISSAYDNELEKFMKKFSQTATTTPLYKAKSPSGEVVEFTPADLVSGGGKIKDSKGNYFKPKDRKGQSLSGRITSPGYGKVKSGGK